jgi:hypothetical protein
MFKKSLVISSSTSPQRGMRSLEPRSYRGTFIVTGAQGNLGQAYLRALTDRFPDAQIYGLHRRPLTGDEV